MHGRFLSLLYAATWLLASTTSALVARNPPHQAREDTTPAYPQGQDAQSCPLGTPTITFQTAPVESQGIILPAALTQRAPPEDQLSQVCRQVGRFRLNPSPSLQVVVTTSTVQPGLYVVSVKLNSMVQHLYVYSVPADLPFQSHVVDQNNRRNSVGARFKVIAPARIHIQLSLRWSFAKGEIALFRLGPNDYPGPSFERE